MNWIKRVRDYEDRCRAEGLDVNLIVNSERGGQPSDELFCRETQQMVDTYLKAGGRPTRWFVQSWYPHPKQIVPETAPHSMTALVKAVIQEVRPDSAEGARHPRVSSCCRQPCQRTRRKMSWRNGTLRRRTVQSPALAVGIGMLTIARSDYSFHRIPIAALSLLLVGVSVTMAQGVKAFPTAEGFGASGRRTRWTRYRGDQSRRFRAGKFAVAWKQPDLASACFESAVRSR